MQACNILHMKNSRAVCVSAPFIFKFCDISSCACCCGTIGKAEPFL